MKKMVMAMAIGVALFNAASAYAGPTSAVQIVTAPEPGSFVQLAVGLLALGGLAFVVRKRVRTTEAN